MKTKYVFLITSQYHQETDPRGDWVRARVQGHSGDSGAESGLDPRATPGFPPPRSALAPVEVPPFPVQAGGKLGPKGPPRFIASLSVLPCPLPHCWTGRPGRPGSGLGSSPTCFPRPPELNGTRGLSLKAGQCPVETLWLRVRQLWAQSGLGSGPQTSAVTP